MLDSLKYTEYRYGTDHELQTLGIWERPSNSSPPPPTSSQSQYWIVYIHGGAWRDPRITHLSALPTFRRLLASPPPSLPPARFAGFASLNYRLSPHPAYPQPPASTPAFSCRAARHPDHVRDVRAALAFLLHRHHHHGAGNDGSAPPSRYVLVGHSAGATLAFQVVMGLGAEADAQAEVELPVCIVGVEGIYDLKGINERFDGGLSEIFEGAFGEDEDGKWDRVSPGQFGGFKETWTGERRLAVLAYSNEDELVDKGEIDTMEDTLKRNGVKLISLRDLKGKHDEIVDDGSEIVRVLGLAITELDRLL